MENGDFVNRYLEKMKAVLLDLTTRNILLETDISFRNETIATQQKQIAELNQSSLNRLINLMIEKEPDLAERLEFSINVAFQEIHYQNTFLVFYHAH